VEVVVSAGRIQVLGTRFVVFQGPRGGHVDLVEGAIRFVPDAGEPRTIVPGERLAWGSLREPNEEAHADPPVEESKSSPASMRARRPSDAPDRGGSPPAPIDVPLDQIAGLRAAGRYGDAVDLIRSIDRARLDRRTAEVLSYEEGSILQDHLDRGDAACRHWAEHLRRFPRGRYDDRVLARHEGCEEPKDPSGN
jgi:hypothetical protein